MVIYNENFINEYDEETYLKYLKKFHKLRSLIYFEKNRYNKKMVNGHTYFLKESLDHYVVKKLMTDSNFQNTIEFKNYLKYMNEIMLYNYELNTNLFFYVFLKEDYRNWFGNNFDVMKNIKSNNLETIIEIYSKIENNQLITQNELDMICTYFSKKKSYQITAYKEKYSVLVAYIFNIFMNNCNQYKFTPQILDTILTYAPIEFASYSKNESNFNLYNIRINSCKYYYDLVLTAPGISTSKNRILINCDFLNVKFDSINDSRVAYKKYGTDFTYLMIVLFHELTHEYQRYLAKKNELNDNGISLAIHSVLRKELNDYKENHDNDMVEIFATAIGWKICENFYQKHLTKINDDIKVELLNNCKNNFFYTLARNSFAIKKNKMNRLFIKDDYDFRNLSMIIKKKTDYLNSFPCLRKFYNDDGEVNIDICFLPNSSLANSEIVKSFISYILTNHKEELSKRIEEDKVRNNMIDLVKNVRDCIQSDIYSYLDTVGRNERMGKYKQRKRFDKVQYILLKRIIYNFVTLEEFVSKINKDDNEYTNINIEFSNLKKDINWVTFVYSYKELIDKNKRTELLELLRKESCSNKYHSYHLAEIINEYESLNQELSTEHKNK